MSGVEAGPHEDRLISRFFVENAYHVSSRPVLVETDAVNVKFGLHLQQIIELVRIFALRLKDYRFARLLLEQEFQEPIILCTALSKIGIKIIINSGSSIIAVRV